MPRIQHGWVTNDSGARLGHFRKNGKIAPAVWLGTVKDMTLTEAREKLRGIVVRELGITGDGTLTFSGFVKHKWLPLHESQWRPSSRTAVLGILKRASDKFDGVALAEIDAVMLAKFLTSLAEKYSASVVKMTHAYLKSIFSEATEQDFLRKNPARLLRIPKHLKNAPHPVLTIPEMQALLKVARPFGVRGREYALLRLLFVAPLRPGELLALRWRDVDLTPGAAMVTLAQTVYKGKLRPYTKTTEEGEVQRIPLSEMAAEALTEWASVTEPKSDDYIFPNSDGGMLNADNYLSRVLIPMAKQAGIEHINFQQIRRSVATHAQHLGSMKDISSLLRHKAAETAGKYYVQEIAATVREVGEGLDAKYAAQSDKVQ